MKDGVLKKMKEEVTFGFKKLNTKGGVLKKMNEEMEFGFQKIEQDERWWGFKENNIKMKF